MTKPLSEHDGTLSDTATANDDTTELVQPTVGGERLRWSLVVTKPIKMTLEFDVTATGDVTSGTAKAGIFPAAKVAGTRVP